MAASFDAITLFDKNYKLDQSIRPFDDACAKRLARRFPEPLLTLLRRDGFASYEKQLIWTCDPDEWNDYALPWFPKKKCEVFMRTAFGSMFIWDGEYCWFAKTVEGYVNFSVEGMDWFLGRFICPKSFFKEMEYTQDTKRGTNEVGRLMPDEVFLWSPALALGGSKEDSQVEKGKAGEALSILANIQGIEIQKI